MTLTESCCQKTTETTPGFLFSCLMTNESREGALQTAKCFFLALLTLLHAHLNSPPRLSTHEGRNGLFFFLLVSPKSIKTFEHRSVLKSITSNLEVKFKGNAVKGCGVSKPECSGNLMGGACMETQNPLELSCVVCGKRAPLCVEGIHSKPITHFLQNK